MVLITLSSGPINPSRPSGTKATGAKDSTKLERRAIGVETFQLVQNRGEQPIDPEFKVRGVVDFLGDRIGQCGHPAEV